MVYVADMNADPGWTLEPLWEYGAPSYAAGNGPASGFTGSNVIAYNLSGDYEDRLTSKYATSPMLNCSGVQNLSLRFQRWLRLRSGDTALIEISTNGINWTTLWSTTQSVSDAAWQPMQYALPDWTFGSPTLQVRWGLSSGFSQNDIGWNIDDVQIVADQSSAASTVELTTAVNNAAWGGVSPASATFAEGSVIQLLAIPSSYYRFLNWTGDVSGTNNPLPLTLSSNISVQANFSELLTTNHPTPYWWLALHGSTNNFDSAAESMGANGMPRWQSYIAGLNPSDPASRFMAALDVSGDDLVLHWNTVTGRVYTVWSSTNSLTEFTPMNGAVDLTHDIQSITNSGLGSGTSVFFRIEVEKP
jgi:hypothetical protein